MDNVYKFYLRVRIIVRATIYRMYWSGQDRRLDQSEAYDISQLVRQNTGPGDTTVKCCLLVYTVA